MPTSSPALPKAIRDEVSRLGSADIMVGIPSFKNAATIGHVARAAQAGLVQYFPDLRPVLVNADAGSPDGTSASWSRPSRPTTSSGSCWYGPRNRLQRLSLTYPEVDGVGGKGAALRTIFQIADALKVEALVVVDSDLRSIVPEWIELLAGPILKGGFDFVTPLYQRYKYDGTITNTVTYPFTRALYGLRIRQPIGGDFGVSGDLVRHYLDQDDWTPDVSKFGVDIWMTTKAISGGFAVCQTRLGAKVHDPKDPGADLGPMFSQVVATLLRLTEEHAERWLAVRGSHDVPAYGFERLPTRRRSTSIPDDCSRSSPRAVINVGDAWQQILSAENDATVRELAAEAETIVEAALRADVDVSVEQSGFSFPDETWARIVYDVIIATTAAHVDRPARDARWSRSISDAWRSLVIETRDMTTEQAEAFVERQARAFELAKPYLVERWQVGRDSEDSRVDASAAGAARPGRILIPLANPRTAADLVRIGAALLQHGGVLTALGIVEVPEGMPLSEGATQGAPGTPPAAARTRVRAARRRAAHRRPHRPPCR